MYFFSIDKSKRASEIMSLSLPFHIHSPRFLLLLVLLLPIFLLQHHKREIRDSTCLSLPSSVPLSLPFLIHTHPPPPSLSHSSTTSLLSLCTSFSSFLPSFRFRVKCTLSACDVIAGQTKQPGGRSPLLTQNHSRGHSSSFPTRRHDRSLLVLQTFV